jgi:pyrroline-5-carboxylate reductase
MASISFIGGGNMARALIGGLIARGTPAQEIAVADPVSAQTELLQREYGIRVAASNDAAVRTGQVVVLAVKPQHMRAVVTEIAPAVTTTHPLLVSVAAGIRTADIRRWCGALRIVRAMPNRPALQGCGVTALFAAHDVTSVDRDQVEGILRSVGPTLWLDDEAQMDAVTAVSGSGPAYFFLLIEMLEQTGAALGLSAEVSRRLAAETAYGAGCMAHAASDSPATLREQVTSRGGTTEAALRHLEAHNVRGIFAAAVTAAARRSAELAQEFGAT